MLKSSGFLCCLCFLQIIDGIHSISPALILTPLIKQNQIAKAKNASVVNPSKFFNLTSHSGYLTVNEKYNSNLFFWYFPATQPTKDQAWIMWLQGGPGASSLDGLLMEMGPFQLQNGLKLREHAWTKEYSMLFIDNPVGAGFSFTDSPDGFIKSLDECSDQLYNALQQFLQMFPNLRSTPLFIAGESYAGRYVPALGVKILESEPYTNETKINLEGLIMGNPIMDREAGANYSAVYYHWGLIDTQGLLAVTPLQNNYLEAIEMGHVSEAVKLRNQLLDRLSEISMQDNEYNVLADGNLNSGDVEQFFNNETVKEAIHAGDIKFTFSNYSVHRELDHAFLNKVEPEMEKLLEHYRVLIYCGQLDTMAACVPTADWRRGWQWSGRPGFLSAPRVPWVVNADDHRIAGYVKSGGRLTEVLVRGAGHLVPMDRPKEAQTLISYFIRDLQLTTIINYKPKPEDTPNIPSVEPSQNTTNIISNNAGLIASVVVNLVLVLAIVIGVLYFLRWKRRGENFFYNAFDDNITDGILTMS